MVCATTSQSSACPLLLYEIALNEFLSLINFRGCYLIVFRLVGSRRKTAAGWTMPRYLK